METNIPRERLAPLHIRVLYIYIYIYGIDNMVSI